LDARPPRRGRRAVRVGRGATAERPGSWRLPGRGASVARDRPRSEARCAVLGLVWGRGRGFSGPRRGSSPTDRGGAAPCTRFVVNDPRFGCFLTVRLLPQPQTVRGFRPRLPWPMFGKRTYLSSP
jgi:hypothetical protein